MLNPTQHMALRNLLGSVFEFASKDLTYEKLEDLINWLATTDNTIPATLPLANHSFIKTLAALYREDQTDESVKSILKLGTNFQQGDIQGRIDIYLNAKLENFSVLQALKEQRKLRDVEPCISASQPLSPLHQHGTFSNSSASRSRSRNICTWWSDHSPILPN